MFKQHLSQIFQIHFEAINPLWKRLFPAKKATRPKRFLPWRCTMSANEQRLAHEEGGSSEPGNTRHRHFSGDMEVGGGGGKPQKTYSDTAVQRNPTPPRKIMRKWRTLPGSLMGLSAHSSHQSSPYSTFGGYAPFLQPVEVEVNKAVEDSSCSYSRTTPLSSADPFFEHGAPSLPLGKLSWEPVQKGDSTCRRARRRLVVITNADVPDAADILRQMLCEMGRNRPAIYQSRGVEDQTNNSNKTSRLWGHRREHVLTHSNPFAGRGRTIL